MSSVCIIQVQVRCFQGHGDYTEIPEEKEFFEATKKSKDIVCQFYKSDSPRCKIVDHHLKILCKSHMEARFCKIDAERCPFLTRKYSTFVHGEVRDV
jgi:hypothetical protein